LPNICILDFLSTNLRLCAIYAPESKSWKWDQLSEFISNKCVLIGDFNVDLTIDSTKAIPLLKWADNMFIAPYVPDSFTSKRSNRTIDYAFSRGFSLQIQTYKGHTTSDHHPIIAILPVKMNNNLIGKNTRWKVFSLFSEFTYSYWKKQWSLENIESTYNNYTLFLSLLLTRCTTTFPCGKYRSSIPSELRCFLSYIRSLSFRYLRTKNLELKKEIIHLKRIAKNELKRFFSTQLNNLVHIRNTSLPAANFFWSKSRNHIKSSTSSLKGLISSSGSIIKNSMQMSEIAADYYETFFMKHDIIKPHPYTDSPIPDFDNSAEQIPEISLNELMLIVNTRKKKKSLDAHGINSFMFNYLDVSHWSFLLDLYNRSFRSGILPSTWKESRMILLAKKDAICTPDLTRPISIIDSFSKIGECLFLSRFKNILSKRGLLPDTQSGFRNNFRLQTRILLFLEDIYGHLANSSPICTLFVDYKSAFDNIWHEGCVGKLRRLGIPIAYTNWIFNWINNRKSFIEINGYRSRWFSIGKGAPQGSVLTPSLFITFHCDMSSFLSNFTSHCFADDVAYIISGQIGLRYSDQCLDLEKRIKSLLDLLEVYSVLTDQPLNYEKTEAMFSSRAIGAPKIDIKFSGHSQNISWKSDFKYLGYIISSKLGWNKLIKNTETKVRKRISLIKSFKIFGCSSAPLRKALFQSYIIPIFTWIYPIFPLLTRNQQIKLSHFYYTSLRRTLFLLEWNNFLISFLLNESSLEDRCASYWNRFFISLADNIDGTLLYEKTNFALFRESWLNGDYPISCLRKNKRFIHHESVIQKVLNWLSLVPSNSSIPEIDFNDLEKLQLFPESFV